MAWRWPPVWPWRSRRGSSCWGSRPLYRGWSSWSVLAGPGAAFDDLVLSHFRAGQAATTGPAHNLQLLLLRREEPLEVLAALGALMAFSRRDRRILAPLAWVTVSLVAVLLYRPLFPHH